MIIEIKIIPKKLAFKGKFFEVSHPFITIFIKFYPHQVVVGAAVGLVHVLNCNPKAIADLVPGDMVVNACIAAAWKTAKEYPANHEDAPPPDLSPPVYNYVSSEQKPLTWGKF